MMSMYPPCSEICPILWYCGHFNERQGKIINFYERKFIPDRDPIERFSLFCFHFQNKVSQSVKKNEYIYQGISYRQSYICLRYKYAPHSTLRKMSQNETFIIVTTIKHIRQLFWIILSFSKSFMHIYVCHYLAIEALFLAFMCIIKRESVSKIPSFSFSSQILHMKAWNRALKARKW